MEVCLGFSHFGSCYRVLLSALLVHMFVNRLLHPFDLLRRFSRSLVPVFASAGSFLHRILKNEPYLRGGNRFRDNALRLCARHRTLAPGHPPPPSRLTCKTAFTASRLLANGEQGRLLCPRVTFTYFCAHLRFTHGALSPGPLITVRYVGDIPLLKTVESLRTDRTTTIYPGERRE